MNVITDMYVTVRKRIHNFVHLITMRDDWVRKNSFPMESQSSGQCERTLPSEKDHHIKQKAQRARRKEDHHVLEFFAGHHDNFKSIGRIVMCLVERERQRCDYDRTVHFKAAFIIVSRMYCDI